LTRSAKGIVAGRQNTLHRNAENRHGSGRVCIGRRTQNPFGRRIVSGTLPGVMCRLQRTWNAARNSLGSVDWHHRGGIETPLVRRVVRRTVHTGGSTLRSIVRSSGADGP
jgi:hypothetical protein